MEEALAVVGVIADPTLAQVLMAHARSAWPAEPHWPSNLSCSWLLRASQNNRLRSNLQSSVVALPTFYRCCVCFNVFQLYVSNSCAACLLNGFSSTCFIGYSLKSDCALSSSAGVRSTFPPIWSCPCKTEKTEKIGCRHLGNKLLHIKTVILRSQNTAVWHTFAFARKGMQTFFYNKAPSILSWNAVFKHEVVLH
jgi:hypothetical protein